MMTNHNKKSHFYGNFKVQITKRKQTEHSMCLSSCGKAGKNVFMEHLMLLVNISGQSRVEHS
jgi:hypothetical protein